MCIRDRLYPYPHEIPWYFYVSIIILPVVLFGLWWAYKNKHKAVFFGLIFFIVNIVFLLQILAAGQGFIADRFTYIAVSYTHLDVYKRQHLILPHLPIIIKQLEVIMQPNFRDIRILLTVIFPKTIRRY